MNCLKNLRPPLSGLLRCRPALRAPPMPTTRCYYASTRPSHEVLQSVQGRLFRRNPVIVCRPPSSHALVFPRYYSSRREPSEFEAFVRLVVAGGVIVYAVVVSIRDGTFETVLYTNRSHFIIYTPKEELEKGELLYAHLKKELDEKTILPPTHPDSVRVSGLAKEIVRAAHRGLADASTSSDAAANGRKKTRRPQTKHLDGINWEVLVVKDDTVNAFCMPGGKIVVNTGLLDNFKTDAEIATVLGHEVGHVIARHGIEKLTKHMGIFILNIVLWVLFGDPKGTADAELTNLLLSLPFSRKMEIEADHIGILLLADAGFDPHIAPTVYEKLGEISGNSSEKEEYKSTHPSSKKRSRLLSQAQVMDKAVALYTEASARKEIEGFFIFHSEEVSFS